MLPRSIFITFFLLSAISAPAAEIVVKSDADLREALAKARAGTTIKIAPGQYQGGLSASNLRGAKGKPIVIEAQDPAHPPVLEGGANAFHLAGTEYLVIRHLAISGMSGNGLNIDDGSAGKAMSHHVLLQGLKISKIGPDGNNDGIKLSGLEDFHILDCTLADWGAGGSGIDMVGCHRGLVESSRFSHTQSEKNNAVQMKGGSSKIVVQACDFRNAGARSINIGGSTGLQFFRPPLKDGEDHAEARDIVVQGCTFVGSGAPIAYVGVDGAIVRFNTIHNPGRWAIRILQETKSPGFVPSRNGEFSDNIVVFNSAKWASGGVNVGGGTAPETFTFARNVWYCADNPAHSRPTLPTDERNGDYGKDPGLADPENGVFTPKSSVKAGATGAFPKAESPFKP